MPEMLELARLLVAAAADAEKVLATAKEKEATLKDLSDSIKGTVQVKEKKEAELQEVMKKVSAAAQELALLESKVKRIKERLAEV